MPDKNAAEWIGAIGTSIAAIFSGAAAIFSALVYFSGRRQSTPAIEIDSYTDLEQPSVQVVNLSLRNNDAVAWNILGIAVASPRGATIGLRGPGPNPKWPDSFVDKTMRCGLSTQPGKIERIQFGVDISRCPLSAFSVGICVMMASKSRLNRKYKRVLKIPVAARQTTER